MDVSVPPELAKINRVAPPLPVTQRDHTRIPAPDATYAVPAPLIEHVTYATPARVEHVPQIFKETTEMMRPTTPAPMNENVAVSPAVTNDGPLPVIGYVAPIAPVPVIEYAAPALGITYDGPAPPIEFMAPAPGASYGGPAPVTEYVAPVLGASDDLL